MVQGCVGAGLNALGVLLAASLPGENIIVAPRSLGDVLGMVAAGATPGSDTDTQLGAAFGCGSAEDLVYGLAALRKINATLGATPAVDTAFANALWYDAAMLGGGLRHSYTARLAQDFRAGTAPLPSSVDPMNQYVKDHTHGMIANLLSPEDLSESTAVVLVNAVYFKAPWRSAFNKSQTEEDGRFAMQHGAMAPTITVPMMHQEFAEGSVLYGAGMQAGRTHPVLVDVLALPYSTEAARPGAVDTSPLRFSGVFMLPQDREVPVDAALAALSEADAATLLMGRLGAPFGPTAVALPRFKVSFGPQSVKAALQARNVTAPFDTSATDQLLGMAPRRDLHVSDVLTATVVEVSELGTTAAAASSASVHTTSWQPTMRFTADRPFVFGIWDHALEVWLFVGKVTRPQPL